MLVGATQLNVIVPAEVVALRPVGTPGKSNVVIELDGSESNESPAEFVAFITNV